MDLNTELSRINQNLTSQGVKLKIERRKELLNLRGPLPCSVEKGKFKVQRISLHLKADQEGLREAQVILQMVLFQLKHKQFSWDHWSTKKSQIEDAQNTRSQNDGLESFKSTFFSILVFSSGANIIDLKV